VGPRLESATGLWPSLLGNVFCRAGRPAAEVIERQLRAKRAIRRSSGLADSPAASSESEPSPIL